MFTATADFAAQPETMIGRQLRGRGINEPQILAAFRAVPREAFVNPGDVPLAYGDHPLPIHAGQSISQPYNVALVIQATSIHPGDRVLEVGAGSGNAAAVINQLAARVIAIERQQESDGSARERLAPLGYDNVEIVDGDGSLNGMASILLS